MAARFFGSLRGQSNKVVTRMGSRDSGLVAKALGQQSGVTVEGVHNRTKDCDYLYIIANYGVGGGGVSKDVATVHFDKETGELVVALSESMRPYEKTIDMYCPYCKASQCFSVWASGLAEVTQACHGCNHVFVEILDDHYDGDGDDTEDTYAEECHDKDKAVLDSVTFIPHPVDASPDYA